MSRRFLIYGRSSCEFCCLACDFLSASRVDYQFFDFEEDRPFLEDAKSFYNFETVPIILENNLSTGKISFIGGYSDLLKWTRDD